MDDGEIFLGGKKMLKYLENVVTLRLDIETCNGCGMCVIVCPHAIFEIRENKAVIAARDACIECGACAINCPVNAIQVQTGAGCATGILLGTIGKNCECSSSCGVSPATNESSQPQPCCCGDQTDSNKANNSTSSCCK